MSRSVFWPDETAEAVGALSWQNTAADMLRSVEEASRALEETAASFASKTAPLLEPLPDLDQLWGGSEPATAPARQTAPDDPFGLPDLASIWPGTPKPAPTRQTAATGVPVAMPTATRTLSTGEQIGDVTVSQGPQTTVSAAGEVDNSSREAFVRTAYPWALQAADGDPTLANQLVATAISENGKVGTGRSLGEMGFNVGGIQGVEGPAGSFTALDAGRPRQFAAYNNLAEGFRAVRDLVTGGPRYQQAYATYQQTGDVDRFWREVNEAGYAEDTSWHTKVGNIRRGQVEPLTRGQAVPAKAERSTQTQANPAVQRAVRVVPAATPNSYWTSEGTHGGAPAADIFAPIGSPILAPVSGTVEPATYPKGGHAATMKGDDGRWYYFAHGNVPFRGGRVEAGQSIGEVGDTGNARGNPHLHYAIASNPSVFSARDGSGDIEGEAYWRTPDGVVHSVGDGHRHAPPPAAPTPPSTPNAVQAGAAAPSPPSGTPAVDPTAAAGASPDLATAPTSPLDEQRAADQQAQPWQASAGDMQRQPLSQQPELPADPVPEFLPGDGAVPPTPDPTYGPPIEEAGPEISYEIADGRVVPPTTGGDWQEVETRPRQVPPQVAEQSERYLDLSMSSPPGWQAIVDTAGNVVDWVRELVSEATAPPAEPTAEERAQNASVAGLEPGQTLTGQPTVSPLRTNTRPPVTATPGEPDYVPPTPSPFGPGGLLEPSGGGPRISGRMDEIAERASRDLGVTNPNEWLTRRAVKDPAWRAANPELADEWDQLEQQLGLTVAGQVGDAARFGRGARKTVEVIAEELDAARRAAQSARRFGDDVAASQAMDDVARLESELIDARNARLDLEPAIRSDVGRPLESLPRTEESADDLAQAMRPAERVTPAQAADLGGPASVPVADPSGRMNVTPGVTPGAGVGSQILTDVSNSLGGGVFGAAVGLAAPAETAEQRRRNALIGAGSGMVLGPAAGRVMRRGGGALGTPGVGPNRPDGPRYDPRLAREPVMEGFEPPRRTEQIPDISDAPNRPPTLGDVPPSQIREPELPGFAPDPARPIAEVTEDLLGATVEQAPVPHVRAEGGQTYLPTLEDRPDIVARISDVLEPWTRRIGIVRYAGMLSDTAGQALNAMSGALMQGVDVVTTPIAATLEAGRVGAARAVGREAQRQVTFGEVPARLAGMRAGSKTGLQAAWDVLRTGLRPEDVVKLDRETAGFGTNVPIIAPEGSRAASVTNFAVEAPLRVLAATDAVFRSIAKGGHAAAEAHAAARKANGGVPPTPEQLREAMKNPELLERIDNLAARTVLQEDRTLTDWWRSAMRYQPASRTGRAALAPVRAAIGLEIPFVRTPYNIVAQGLGMTPAGYLGLVQDIVEGKAPREMAYRAARASLGTAVMAGAMVDYAGGNLTGPYPTDSKERSTLPPGWQPWARKVTLPNGETRYVSLALLGPLAVPAVVGILAGEAQKRGKPQLSPAWAGAVALGIGKYAEQNTFFEGFTNIAKLFDERTGEASLERHVEQIASQFSPHIVGGGALGRELQRIMGMPLRDPEGAIEALLATHPATADRVPARQDVLGRPMQTAPTTPDTAVIRSTVERDAPVIRAFRRSGEGLPMTAPRQARDPNTDQMRTLSRDQKIRWRQAFGRELQIAWDGYGRPQDIKTLRQIEQDARTAATETVFGLR